MRFVLADGETINVGETELKHVYDALWDLASERGAVSAAAQLQVASHAVGTRRYVELTKRETHAFRKAITASSRVDRAALPS